MGGLQVLPVDSCFESREVRSFKVPPYPWDSSSRIRTNRGTVPPLPMKCHDINLMGSVRSVINIKCHRVSGLQFSQGTQLGTIKVILRSTPGKGRSGKADSLSTASTAPQ